MWAATGRGAWPVAAISLKLEVIALAKQKRDEETDAPATPPADMPIEESSLAEVSIEGPKSVEQSDLAQALNKAQDTTAIKRMQAEIAAKELNERESDLNRRRADAKRKRDEFEASQKREAELELMRLEAERTIPILVQQRKGRDVRLSTRVAIKNLVPTLVTRRELRQLEGLRARGAIQLIVGKIEKPGAVLELDK